MRAPSTDQSIRGRFKPRLIEQMENEKRGTMTLPPIDWPKAASIPDKKQAAEIDRIWRIAALIPEPLLRKSSVLKGFLNNMNTLAKRKETGVGNDRVDLSVDIYESEMLIWYLTLQMMKGGISWNMEISRRMSENEISPDDPAELAAYNTKTGNHVQHIFKRVEGDQFSNKIGMFTAGVCAAVAGIYVAATLRAMVIAGEVAIGWKVPTALGLA